MKKIKSGVLGILLVFTLQVSCNSSSPNKKPAIDLFSQYVEENNGAARDQVAGVSEGDQDNLIYFVLALNGNAENDIYVSYQTVDDTAVAGKDYYASSGVALLPKGSRRALIAVKIIGDFFPEEDQSFSLVISNPIGINFPEGVSSITANHTILNDDSSEKSKEFSATLTRLVLSSMPTIFEANQLLDQPRGYAFANAFLADNLTATLACDLPNTSFSYVFTDDGSNDKKYSSPQDNFSVTANQCSNENGAINGGYSLTINQWKQDMPQSGRLESRVTASLSSLSYNTSGQQNPSTLTGNIVFDRVEVTDGSSTPEVIQFESSRLDLVSNGNYKFTDLKGRTSDDVIFNERTFSEFSSNLQLGGSTVNGQYTLAITKPFKKLAINDYPHDGVMHIKSSDGKINVLITVQSSESVHISATGTSIVDHTHIVKWGNLSFPF